MVTPCLHHILIAVRELERSRRFYTDVLELREIARPAFSRPGLWFQFGGGQHLHIVVRDDGTDRGNKPLDTFDVHFALGMSSFAKTAAWLRGNGYREDAPNDDPHKLILRPGSLTGRPQIYIMDPDHNIIEFSCDAVD